MVRFRGSFACVQVATRHRNDELLESGPHLRICGFERPLAVAPNLHDFGAVDAATASREPWLNAFLEEGVETARGVTSIEDLKDLDCGVRDTVQAMNLRQ